MYGQRTTSQSASQESDQIIRSNDLITGLGRTLSDSKKDGHDGSSQGHTYDDNDNDDNINISTSYDYDCNSIYSNDVRKILPSLYY